ARIDQLQDNSFIQFEEIVVDDGNIEGLVITIATRPIEGPATGQEVILVCESGTGAGTNPAGRKQFAIVDRNGAVGAAEARHMNGDVSSPFRDIGAER